MEKYDIVIIGAGPAGSFLANRLKNKNLKVLILEKKEFPRYKSCAGGLSKKAYDILYSENKDIKNVIEKTVKNALYVRDEKFISINTRKNLIYMTYRAKLDNFLLTSAVDNKTIFFKDNIKIKKINTKNNQIIFTKGKKQRNISYKILVGAWGNNIRLNRMVDLYPFKYFDLSSSWEGPSSSKFNKFENKYFLTQFMNRNPSFVFYIFPKNDLITAGLFTSRFPVKSNCNSCWDDFLKFWNLDKKIKPKYAIIPVRNFNKPISSKNILLVGDAAGLADPFTGEGIYYAIISSIIAGNNIEKYFKEKNFNLSKNYEFDIYKKLFYVLNWGGFYRYLFNKFPNLSFWFGSETKWGNHVIISFINGEIKYNELQKILKYPFLKIFS